MNSRSNRGTPCYVQRRACGDDRRARRDVPGSSPAARAAFAGSRQSPCSLFICGQRSAPTSAWPQVPDNRGVWLDPEDPVSPAYRETLDQRDWQRMEHAAESGESFISTLQGTGRAPGDERAGRRDGGLGPSGRRQGRDGQRYRRGRRRRSRRSHPVPVYETMVQTGVSRRMRTAATGSRRWSRVLLESWTRPPEIARLRYAPADRGTPR